MGKGRRGKGPSKSAPARASETSHQTETELGNAAQLDSMEGAYIPMDAAGDGARPVVEHARLALEVRYEGDTPVSRLTALLDASALPDDNKAWLSDRLRAQAATENRVNQAVLTAFGGTLPEARAQADQVLSGVAERLSQGRATEDCWVVQGDSFDVPRAHTVREAVDHLVASLCEIRGAETAQLCRAMALSVLLDDDEDDVDVDWIDGLSTED